MGIWWPDDEYQLIRLSAENKLVKFYAESKCLLGELLQQTNNLDLYPLLEDSIKINLALLKQPNFYDDLEIKCDHNILEVYTETIKGHPLLPKRIKSTYHINRSTQTWDDWQTWCREVIWYGNKKGDYLYGSNNYEKEYAGHY